MTLRIAVLAGAFGFLMGCGGTPAVTPAPVPTPSTPEIDRLSDVALAENAPTTIGLAATPQEIEQGFLGQVFNGTLGDDQPTAPATGGFLGLFAPSGAARVNRTGPDAQVIPYGESVAYGAISTVCDVPNGSLGTLVANVGGFKIYDTIPNATALRPHFITGFDDGCARQFSAALSLTGDVGTHEIVRYMPSNASRPYSGTDTAYEAIKASFCRARHGAPCGNKIDALSNKTTFITAYERFGADARWVEILLHDGAVTAVDFVHQ